MKYGSSRSWDSGSRSSVVVVWILIGKSKVSRIPVSGCRRMEHEYGRSPDTAAGELVYDFWIFLGSDDALQWVENSRRVRSWRWLLAVVIVIVVVIC